MMDREEILISFRCAKHKAQQIEILADLNTCAPREIAQIIEDAGELEPAGLSVLAFSAEYSPIESAKAGRSRAAQFDEIRAMELFKAGLIDEAIADQLGVKVYQVKRWRSANNLKRSYSWNNYASKKRKKDLRRPTEDTALARISAQEEDSKMREAAVPEAEPKNTENLSDCHVEPPKKMREKPPLTLSRLWAALNRMMTPDLLNAELRINGRADMDVRGYEVKVSNNRVYVDLYLRGEDGA